MRSALALILIIVSVNLAFSQQPADPANDDAQTDTSTIEEDALPPFEKQLLRLSEVLGALHFLRQICDEADAPKWRVQMSDFLNAENPSPLRRAKFIGEFNRAFKSYSANYTSCTPSAKEATRRFIAEGKTIAESIVIRYAN